MVISRYCFAVDGTDLFITACRTCSTLICPHSTNQNIQRSFFHTRPITFFICGVVVAVVVVDAKAPRLCTKVRTSVFQWQENNVLKVIPRKSILLVSQQGGHRLHQLRGVVITLHMRTNISSGQVSVSS